MELYRIIRKIRGKRYAYKFDFNGLTRMCELASLNNRRATSFVNNIKEMPYLPVDKPVCYTAEREFSHNLDDSLRQFNSSATTSTLINNIKTELLEVQPPSYILTGLKAENQIYM
jgi:hypothetical protein